MGFGKKRTNWERISSRTPSETTRFRDVYEDQQLDRSKISSHVSMRGRLIFTILVSIAVFILCYMVFSFVEFGAYKTSQFMDTSESSQSVVEQIQEDVDAISAPPTVAPVDISYEDFLANYFVLKPAGVDKNQVIDLYVDCDNKEYSEADVKVLWNNVKDGKYLTEDALLWQTLLNIQENNAYGLFPWSYAPMNITFEDFLDIYFDKSSAVAWRDYDGNLYYTLDEIRSLWTEIQAGVKGSGKTSDFEPIGGNSGFTESDDGENTVVDNITYGDFIKKPSAFKIIVSLLFAAVTYLIVYQLMCRNFDAQTAEQNVEDINQYSNDQHIALPEEIMEKFDWFPDVGAHCSVQVSSMISHVMLSNKGLHKIKMARRAEKDIKDNDGDIVYYKGEILLDDDGHAIVDIVPTIDEAFGEALFDASGLPKDNKKSKKEEHLRKRYEPTLIKYNPGNENRGKLKGYNTVADMVNGDWFLPEYEPQRPAGAYLVDTEPVNTMVLAITRAGKGECGPVRIVMCVS